MLKLCGFPVSNYFNKARLVLEEKGIAHEIDPGCFPSQEEAFRARSPMGRIPFLETEHGTLVESGVIAEYLEDTHPEKPLLPRDAFERARVRAIVQTLELNVELVARRLYGAAFFGGSASDETKKEVAEQIERGVRAFKSMVKFSPFIAGSELTLADCAAVFHLPYIAIATKMLLGKDALESIPEIGDYLKMMNERPTVQKVNADREKALAFIAATRKKREEQAAQESQATQATQATQAAQDPGQAQS
jgi:glutathione S-transferase